MPPFKYDTSTIFYTLSTPNLVLVVLENKTKKGLQGIYLC